MDAAGGGMGDLGGEGDLDLGGEGDLDLGGEGDLDLGGEDLGGEGGADDTALLATPGRREDNPTENRHQGGPHKRRPGSDRRKGSAEQMSGGPLRREMRRQARGPELGSTYRTKFPGKVSLKALSSNIGLPKGLEEQEQPTYTDDETVLFRNTTKVRRLVEAMERKEEEKNET